MAYEAYSDPLGFKNPHNYYLQPLRCARMGFELVRHIHNVEHDTHCFVFKDVPRGVRVFGGLEMIARDNFARNVSLLGTLGILNIFSCWGRSCVYGGSLSLTEFRSKAGSLSCLFVCLMCRAIVSFGS